MYQSYLSTGVGRVVGAVMLHNGGEGPQSIGDVILWENGQYDLHLAVFPYPNQDITINFAGDTGPSDRRFLAAMIRMPADELRFEIGEVQPARDGVSKVSLYGVPTFPADLRF